jgi:hypothetical protein
LGTAADVRRLSPLSLWAGILAGPLAWGLDLMVSYALVKGVCASQRTTLFQAITAAALAIVAGGLVVSSLAVRRTAADVPTDGGAPRQRARFMALVGVTSGALFALAIVANAIPWMVLDACR